MFSHLLIVTILPLTSLISYPRFSLSLSGLSFVLSGRRGRGHAKQEDLPLPEEDQASEIDVYRDPLFA